MKPLVAIVTLLAVALVWQAAVPAAALVVLMPLLLLAAWWCRRCCPWRVQSPPLLLLIVLALLAYIAVQAANPSHRQVGAGLHLLPLSPVPWLPQAVDRPAALLALLRVVLYAGLFGLAWRALPQSRHDLLLALLLGIGVVLAVVGIIDRPVGPLTRQPMGPFGNENHFAAYLNLLLAPGLAVALMPLPPGRRTQDHPARLAYAGVAILAAGVVVSESRAGLLVMGLTAGTWALMEFRIRRGNSRGLSLWPGLCVAGLLGLVLLSLAAPGHRHWQRLAGDGFAKAMEQRALIWSGVMAMGRDNPLFGVGAGGFAAAYPYYQPPALEGVCSTAHNDGLQAVAELGLVGGGLLAAGLLVLARDARRACATGDRVACACVLALLGLGLHAMLESPLQVPALVMLAVVLAGLVSSRAERVRQSPVAACA